MPVDLTSAVRFDLCRGTVNMGAVRLGEERAVLVPEDVLADLVAAAGPEASAAAARQLGASIGQRVSDALGGPENVRGGTLEQVIGALAGEVSVCGFGSVTLERWGRALVLVVGHAPRLDADFFAPMLQGAIEAAVTNVAATSSEQQVRCTLLGRDEGFLRILVASGRAVERVRAWLTEGVSGGEALERLQASPRRE